MTSTPTHRVLVPDNEPRYYELPGDLTLPDALLAESSDALHRTCPLCVGHIFLLRTQLINETKDNIPPPPTNRLKMMRPDNGSGYATRDSGGAAGYLQSVRLRSAKGMRQGAHIH